MGNFLLILKYIGILNSLTLGNVIPTQMLIKALIEHKVSRERCMEFNDALEGNMDSFDSFESAKFTCCTMYVVTRTRKFNHQMSSDSNSTMVTRFQGARFTHVR